MVREYHRARGCSPEQVEEGVRAFRLAREARDAQVAHLVAQKVAEVAYQYGARVAAQARALPTPPA